MISLLNNDIILIILNRVTDDIENKIKRLEYYIDNIKIKKYNKNERMFKSIRMFNSIRKF
jgi:hypothetical protein